MTPKHTSSAPRGWTSSEERVMRVFVSSTFSDMHDEREELVKRVFPQLRRLCERRSVTWGEVDLRWGVTDEQRAAGNALPICLAQIDRCRPYFVALLGDRYGFVPEGISPRVLDQYPWLRRHQGSSVTELEILHGALNDPSPDPPALFYLRAAGSHAPLSGAAHVRRLSDLKERVRRSRHVVRDGYRDARALGDLVLADVTALIDREFPEGSQPDPLDRDALDHHLYALKRSRCFVPRREYAEDLDRHAAGDGPPLVLYGQPGSGKSSILANWTLARESKSPEPSLVHFIGSSPLSADWTAIVSRLMRELKRRLGLTIDIPDRRDELADAFAAAIRKVDHRLVLVIDGLNQIEGGDAGPELSWLPANCPEAVRLVLSTTTGYLDALRLRKWTLREVGSLTPDQRRQVISVFLQEFGKKLLDSRINHIANTPQAGNPLFLRALLEEVRVYGDHTSLDAQLEHYVSASTPTDLYDRILERYERDYGPDMRGQVGYAFANLWAARRGLSENELLHVLGDFRTPVPLAEWLPLSLAAEGSLVERSGIISFSHDYVRQAVEKRYLSTEEDRRWRHQMLGMYFQAQYLLESQETGIPNERCIEETLWQLMRAQKWDLAAAFLSDPKFIGEASARNPYQVAAYWAELERSSSHRVLTLYERTFDAREEYGLLLHFVATLLEEMGYLSQALTLREYLLAHPEVEKLTPRPGMAIDVDSTLAAFRSTNRVRVAALVSKLGDTTKGLELLRQEEQSYRQAGDEYALAALLANQAAMLQSAGDLDRAVVLATKAEAMYRERRDKTGISVTLHTRAAVAHERGQLDEALALYREAEASSRSANDLKGVASALGGQAGTLASKGAADEALRLALEEEQIYRRLGDTPGIARSMDHRARALAEKGLHYEALVLLREMEPLCRELGEPGALVACLAHQATALLAEGRSAAALRIAEEAHRLAREHGLTAVVNRLEAQVLSTVRANRARRGW